MKKRITVMFLLFVFLTMAALPAFAAPEASAPWILRTNGTPIYCGNASRLYREEVPGCWPTVANAQGEELAADVLAASGNLLHYTTDGIEESRLIVLLGDLNGSRRFDIAQMVTLAALVSGQEGTALQEAAADLNGSGAPDIADLVILAGYVREDAPPQPPQPYPQPVSEKTTLVACFSATGNTRRIADMIASLTDADVFESDFAN